MENPRGIPSWVFHTYLHYLVIDGRRYYVCEPTCSGHMAPGRSAVSLAEAKAISVFRER